MQDINFAVIIFETIRELIDGCCMKLSTRQQSRLRDE